jgi:Ca-activated chloride channel family protein
MDERQLKDILEADDVPAADENARKRAMNLALGAFDEAQRDKEKNRQGVGLPGRLTDRSNNRSGRRPMKKWHLVGGMATAMTVVLAVVTYDVAKDRGLSFGDGSERRSQGILDGRQGAKQPKSERDAAQLPKSGDKAPASNERRERETFAKDDLKAKTARPEDAPVARPSKPKPIQPPVAAITQSPPRQPSTIMPGAASGAMVERLQGQRRLAERSRVQAKNMGRADDTSGRYYKDVGRDQFQQFVENEIKRVGDAPVSTFSVDVDTASYSFMRRQLNRGVLPQKNAIRIEELVNYFDYAYPLPASRERPFHPSVSVTPSPWKKGNKLIHIGIKGYDIDADVKPRSNLVFLLDVSGSMNAPDKLPLMINSLKLLLDTLKPDDTVAIVVYAGAAGTVLEPTRAAEKHKILAALDRLRAGGSTAGAAGIRQAYALAQSTFDKKAVNRVILATDGDFNVGITNREELKGFVERKRKTGVFLSVFGFGQGNLNDHLMQTLAQNGNGVAAHIDTLNEARKVLVEEASSTLFPIAKDVKLQVEFNPATVAEYRLIGYETRALKREDFKNDKVDAGDIGAGHTVTAIYEITPVKGGEPMIGASRYRSTEAAKKSATKFGEEYAFLKIRYKLPDQDKSTLISTPITVANEVSGNAALQARETRWATAVAAFGQILKGGKYTGGYTYDDVVALANTAKGDDPFGYRAEFINLVRLARSVSGRSGK